MLEFSVKEISYTDEEVELMRNEVGHEAWDWFIGLSMAEKIFLCSEMQEGDSVLDYIKIAFANKK